MKLRIKGNSLRIRLTKTEVGTLAVLGYLEEQTLFAGNKLVYALQCMDSGNELSATFDTVKITMYVPGELIKDWPQNNVIGFNTDMPVSENDTLHLLLEKDFVCLDEIKEDQSDHYENPNKTC
jgi:hypothetical protein